MANDIKNKAISGALWTGFEKIGRQMVRFIVGVVLARLVLPADYGAVGMLAIFMAIANVFTDSGMGSALIQKKDKTDADYSTVFWYNLLLSCFFYALMFVSSPWIAAFYKMPILEDVMRVVAVTLVTNALATVQITRLTVNLKFREQSLVSMASVILSGGIGIILAYKGLGVWALVFYNLAGSIINGLLIWLVARWMPSLTFSKQSFLELFGFGSRILGSSLINTIYQNLSTLVIGRLFSPAEVGFYNRGASYAQLPTATIQDVALKVNYPILAKYKEDDCQLLRAYKKMMTVPLYVLYPVLIGMTVTAEPLICVMIGEKWLPAAAIMQILCLGCMFAPLTHMNLNLLYVKGRSDLVLKLELIKKPIGFALLLGSCPFGIKWMVVSQAIYSFVAFSFNCFYTGKILNYGEFKQLKALMPIFANSFIMGGIVYFAISFVYTPVAKLAVGVPVGIIVYIAVSIIIHDSSFFEILNIIKGRLIPIIKTKNK